MGFSCAFLEGMPINNEGSVPTVSQLRTGGGKLSSGGPDSNISGLASQIVSVGTIQLCCCHANSARDNT